MPDSPMKQATEIIAQLNTQAVGDVVALVFDMKANMEETSPVDTGWLRANFIFGVNEFSSDPPSPTERPSGDDSVAKSSRSAASEIRILSLRELPRNFISITNNVPYLDAVNSRQGTRNYRYLQRAIQEALTENGAGEVTITETTV